MYAQQGFCAYIFLEKSLRVHTFVPTIYLVSSYLLATRPLRDHDCISIAYLCPICGFCVSNFVPLYNVVLPYLLYYGVF